MITPHIATRTPAAAIARQTLDNLAALQADVAPTPAPTRPSDTEPASARRGADA